MKCQQTLGAVLYVLVVKVGTALPHPSFTEFRLRDVPQGT